MSLNFYNFRYLHSVFNNWKFFFKRQKRRLKLTRYGYSLESSGISANMQQNSIDNVKMAFWLLDLREKGFSSRNNADNILFNMNWNLVKGENSFVKLYGQLNDDDVSAFNLHQISKSNDFDKKILQFLFCYLLNKYNIKLDLSFKCEGPAILSINQKKFLCFTLPENLFNTFSSLNENKDFFNFSSINSVELEKHSMSKYYFKNKFNQSNSFLNGLYLYNRFFGYFESFGVNKSDVFEDMLYKGHYSGRFKYLPGRVANFDEPVSVADSLGFHQYLRFESMQEVKWAHLLKAASGFMMPGKFNLTSPLLNDNFIFSDFCNDSQFSEKLLPSAQSYNLVHKAWIKQIYTLSPPYGNDYFYYDLNFKFNSFLNKNAFFCFKKASFFTTKDQFKIYLAWFNLNLKFWCIFDLVLFSNFFKFFSNVFIKKNLTLTYFHQNSDVLHLFHKAYFIYENKQILYKKAYFNLISLDSIYLERFMFKMKDLLFLKTDVGSNWGYFTEPFNFNNQQEEADDDVLEEDETSGPLPFSYNFESRNFLDTIRHRSIIDVGNRPYKWLFIPELQLSPFLYFFSNLRSFWFYLFDQTFPLQTTYMLSLKEKFSYNLDTSCNRYFEYLFSFLYLYRYVLLDDINYNKILYLLHSKNFFNFFFGNTAGAKADFAFAIEHFMKSKSSTPNYSNFNILLNSWLKAGLYPRHLINYLQPRENSISLLNFNNFITFNDNNSEEHWLTEYLTSNQMRMSLAYRIGLNQTHFNFFSFLDPNFFEEAVLYKQWLKSRLTHTYLLPELTWREFTYFRAPSVAVLSDITLSKYKSDFLHLLEQGFGDTVFNHNIYVKNFYRRDDVKRDVFDFEEFTAPFFLFDSDISSIGSVPQAPIFNKVSSFGIPSLERERSVLDISKDLITDFNSNLFLVKDKRGTELLWQKDKHVFLFTSKELNVFDNFYTKGTAISAYNLGLKETSVRGRIIFNKLFVNLFNSLDYILYHKRKNEFILKSSPIFTQLFNFFCIFAQNKAKIYTQLMLHLLYSIFKFMLNNPNSKLFIDFFNTIKKTAALSPFLGNFSNLLSEINYFLCGFDVLYNFIFYQKFFYIYFDNICFGGISECIALYVLKIKRAYQHLILFLILIGFFF